jgi:uncharacterized protein DUF4760
MESSEAIPIGAAFATCGWLYGARRVRTLSRKQHTVNVIMQASFSKDYREALSAISKAVKEGKCPDLQDGNHSQLKEHLKMVANHLEFVSAGLRNGDFDEPLIKDSWRGQIVIFFEFYHDEIWKLRNSRQRQTIYEHLEWLHKRWQKTPPNLPQRCYEKCVGRPISGRKVNPHS